MTLGNRLMKAGRSIGHKMGSAARSIGHKMPAIIDGVNTGLKIADTVQKLRPLLTRGR